MSGYYPALGEFLKLSRRGNLIPVYKEITADLDTPVSAYLKLSKDSCSFLLESVEGQEKIARYSFLGSMPSLVFTSKGRDIRIEYPHKKAVKEFATPTDPLDEIGRIMRGFKPVPIKGLPRFYGGLVGYIGYDMVRFFEELPDQNPDDLGLADSVLMLTDTILIFDHINHTIKIVTNVALPAEGSRLGEEKKAKIYREAVKKIDSIERDLNKPLVSARGRKAKARSVKPESNFKKSEFRDIVNKAKAYIKKGDIIQAVLSQRFRLDTDKQPFDIYRALRSVNPSPYMFFLKLGDTALIGSSPEMLVRCEDGVVQTRPIAGTRPRGKTEAEDRRLGQELLNDGKERAEHLMLVDLGRNDLGRVSKMGKVRMSEFMAVERYSHVMHIVSEVRGELQKGYSAADVLRACFPAGTVTGSPKIRAMEIIDELENIRRGPYAGCVGYFSFSGNLDTCITIRTILVKGRAAYVQAGAGIVADSHPEREYLESVNKARGMIEAIRR